MFGKILTFTNKDILIVFAVIEFLIAPTESNVTLFLPGSDIQKIQQHRLKFVKRLFRI